PASFTYDGLPHSLAATGLPSGTTVSYSNNGQTEAGTYTVTATVTGADYNDFSADAVLTIDKAAITGVTFVPASFTYDGLPHSLAATGLPSGTTVSYSNNGQTEAGTYTVTATVTGADYNDFSADAVLTVNQLAITGVTFVPASFTYDG